MLRVSAVLRTSPNFCSKNPPACFVKNISKNDITSVKNIVRIDPVKSNVIGREARIFFNSPEDTRTAFHWLSRHAVSCYNEQVKLKNKFGKDFLDSDVIYIRCRNDDFQSFKKIYSDITTIASPSSAKKITSCEHFTDLKLSFSDANDVEKIMTKIRNPTLRTYNVFLSRLPVDESLELYNVHPSVPNEVIAGIFNKFSPTKITRQIIENDTAILHFNSQESAMQFFHTCKRNKAADFLKAYWMGDIDETNRRLYWPINKPEFTGTSKRQWLQYGKRPKSKNEVPWKEQLEKVKGVKSCRFKISTTGESNNRVGLMLVFDTWQSAEEFYINYKQYGIPGQPFWTGHREVRSTQFHRFTNDAVSIRPLEDANLCSEIEEDDDKVFNFG